MSLLSLTLRQQWQDLLFMHYAVDPSLIQAQLPPGLTVETHRDMGWLSVVPFTLSYALPGLPITFHFNELNLRTYVTATPQSGGPSQSGVYFFCLDASDFLSVEAARAFYYLNYFNAKTTVQPDPHQANSLRFTSSRDDARAQPATFDASYTKGGPPLNEDLEAHNWLTNRYRLFTAHPRRGTLHTATIAHDPWPLLQTTVDVRANSLWQAHGFDTPTGPPLCSYTPGLAVTTYPLKAL
jgi:uncharacterized protein